MSASPTVSTSPSCTLSDYAPAPSVSPSSQYAIFRKRFKVPSMWGKNPHFIKLQAHRYDVESHALTMEVVDTQLALMGYKGCSVAMKHDYLCFLMEDVLSVKGMMFLGERDLRQPAYHNIARFIAAPGKTNGVTPDFMFRYGNKLVLLDVYTGDKPDEVNKEKYKHNPAMYEVIILNTKWFRATLESKLPELFTTLELQMMEQNLLVFETEWQYWRSCLAMKMILRNEHDHLDTSPLSVEESISQQKQKFSQIVLRKFELAIQAASWDE